MQVVGHKVYIPNIIFRLVQNFTLPGKPYNPYEATFRIPQSVTKTDVRSYLAAVYGVQTTYIRTDNQATRDAVKAQILMLTRKSSPGWVWGTILKKIAEQRVLREQFIPVTKECTQEARGEY